jgi:hypothetical protein
MQQNRALPSNQLSATLKSNVALQGAKTCGTLSQTAVRYACD